MMRARLPITIAVCLTTLLGPRVAAGQSSELTPREIKVERVKPPKDTRNTLRFLRENLDFLRGQLDYLNERPVASDRAAVPFDSTALRLGALLESANASRSVPEPSSSMTLEALLAAELELTKLEARMDAQESRLAELQALYLDSPATALLVVGRGLPSNAVPRLRDDGGTEASIAAPARDAGLAELYYERVEPREQTWTLELPGEEPIYLSFAPHAGETTVLELDLSAHEGGLPLRARLWGLE